MGQRLISVVLVLLLVVIHAQLWTGRGSVPKVHQMQKNLDTQQAANRRAREANDRLSAEVNDLKEGLDMVEEKARMELGMVRPNEIYVHVTGPQPLRKSSP